MKQAIQLRQLACSIEYRVHDQAPVQAPHILLLHGHSSSMEEFDDLVPLLAPHAHLYLFDQPCCGQSDDVDCAAVRAKYQETAFPALTYLRDVCAEFVRLVVKPALPAPHTLRVAGGSLGGNLALWIAVQNYTWLRDVMVWSPASAWRGDLFQVPAVTVALNQALKDWTGRRNEYLDQAFCQQVVGFIPNLTRPQPWYWYADHWGGGELTFVPSLSTQDGSFVGSSQHYPFMSKTKVERIQRSFLSCEQRFNKFSASWHWQVAGEQLRFSHRDGVQLPNGKAGPRIANLQCHTRFMAGELDDNDPASLFRYTRELAAAAKANLVNPALHAIWEPIANSGHSVHNERPDFLQQRLLGPIDA